MSSKALLLLGLVAAMLLLISSEARDLAETSKGEGFNDQKYRDGGGYYNGPGGGYRNGPGGGGYNRGGGGGRGRCYHGCCGGYHNGGGCRCCSSTAEAAQFAAQVKPQN